MYVRHTHFMSPNLMVGIKIKNYGPADAGMQPQTARAARSRTRNTFNGLDSQKGSAEEREQGTH
jgi:hypothetical protein